MLNQSRVIFVSFGIRAIKTLKWVNLLSEMWSWVKFLRQIFSGNSCSKFCSRLRISSLCRSLTRKVNYFNLLFEILSTLKLLWSLPISLGSISRQLLSKLMTSNFWQSPILLDKYLIWFLAAKSLVIFRSCINMRPSNSTISQLEMSRMVTFSKIYFS